MNDNNKYGNCLVKNIDGIEIFRCAFKKAKWYLDRNLATIESEIPFIIKLNFITNGNGHQNDEYYLGKKDNACVICNSEENLTKHHIVPYEYRRYFPLYFKEHSSHDIVIICNDHHAEYENTFASQLKEELAAKYNAPIKMTDEQKNLIKCKKYAKLLLDKRKNLTDKRKNEILIFLKQFYKKDINNNDILEISNIDTNFKKHGEIVFENIKSDIQDFVKMWRKHFIDSMNPNYMPNGWNINKRK